MFGIGFQEIIILTIVIVIPVVYASKTKFDINATLLEKGLHFFEMFWAMLLAESVVFSIIGTYLSTKDIFDTIIWVQETFSPFNIAQFLVACILVSPALLADILREKIAKKRNQI